MPLHSAIPTPVYREKWIVHTSVDLWVYAVRFCLPDFSAAVSLWLTSIPEIIFTSRRPTWWSFYVEDLASHVPHHCMCTNPLPHFCICTNSLLIQLLPCHPWGAPFLRSSIWICTLGEHPEISIIQVALSLVLACSLLARMVDDNTSVCLDCCYVLPIAGAQETRK